MSSSEDESTAAAESLPSKRSGRKLSPKPASRIKTKSRQARSPTPPFAATTRQEQKLMKYRAEEDSILPDFKFDIEEGWSNPLVNSGLAIIRDKRSDDNMRTYGGITFLLLFRSKYMMKHTSIRLATERGDKERNRLIVGMPKLDESTLKAKKQLIKNLSDKHGKSISRDEGIRRSLNKVETSDKQYFELTLLGVTALVNSEWQGDGAKRDPCYLKVCRDVLGNKPIDATYSVSVEVASEYGVEDIAGEESEDNESEEDAIAEKLRNMGLEEDEDDDGSEDEDSDGECLT